MILIFAQTHTPRLRYTLDLVFRTVLGIDVLLSSDKEAFQQSDLPRINYSDENFGSGLFLKCQPLLFTESIEAQNPETVDIDGQKYFFPSSADSFLPFDVFAASFYIASRYEEYLYRATTDHGRFPARESILSQLKLLRKPVINQWAQLVYQHLQQAFPSIQRPPKRFRFEATIDVDNAWAYKNKPWGIQLGAIAKALLQNRISDLKARLQVISGRQNDPYDTFSALETMFAENPAQLRFFFLLGNRGQYDRNISHKNKELHRLIQHLAEHFSIGIHPSYASFDKPELLKREKKRLEHIICEPVSASRQHFLRLRFPDTYQQLVKEGIQDDFTMGYSDEPGFRAGLCTPFYFFNLNKNEQENLVIHPFQVMDVTLKNYLQQSPDEALQTIFQLLDETKKVNGTFSCLWHNESLSDDGSWSGWRTVFDKMVKKAQEPEHE